MRIFLSYASERREPADAVALALRSQGHTVFFDRDDLPPGTSYDDQIRKAIRASHLLIFLISPESVDDGRYTLTELAFARRHWPSPHGRVLPVQLAPTPLDAVPGYLKAVTILTPRGNVPAEVADAVAELARRRTRWRAPAAAGAAVLLTATAAAIWLYAFGDPLVVEALDSQRSRAALFGEAPVFQVRGRLGNRSRQALELADLEVQTEPPDRLQILPDWVLSDGLRHRPPDSTAAVALPVRLADAGTTDLRWRLCARSSETARACSGWQNWTPEGDFAPAVAFTLPDDVRRRALVAAALDDGFALALTAQSAEHGPQLVELSAQGAVRARVELPGEPVALAVWAGTVMVATTSPNALAAYRAGSLREVWTRPIRFAGDDPATAFNEPPSTSPVSIAATAQALWLITGGGTGGAVIAHLDLADVDHPPERLIVPPYQQEVAGELRDMHLITAHDKIWGAVSNTTPASIYRFDENNYQAYDGHDYDVVQCASDVTNGSDQRLVTVDCDGSAVAISLGDAAVDSVRALGRLFDLKPGPQSWDIQHLAAKDAIIVGTSDLSDRSGGEVDLSTTIARLTAGEQQSKTLLNLEGTTTRSIALGGNGAGGPFALVVLEKTGGRREALALRL